MPIALTTDFNPGDIDAGQTYSEAKIVEFRMGIENFRHITIMVEYGNTVNGNWVAGKAPLKSYTLVDAEYNTLYTDNAALIDSVAAVLYGWLQANHAEFAGTIQ